MIVIVVTALLYFPSFANGFKTTDCGSVLGEYSKVTISGCSTKHNNICSLRRGSSTTVEVDFVPYTSVSELRIVAHVFSGWLSMRLPYPRPDPCVDRDSGIECPIAKGKEYRYKAIVPVSTHYPAISLSVRWELQDRNGKDILCIIVPVHIRQ